MDLTELAENLSVIIGALALISGIRAWKREYIGKRKIELAEDTLMAQTNNQTQTLEAKHFRKQDI